MSQNEKYTFLLMRDDSSVRRVRIARGWLKFLFIFLFLIVICGGLSIWLGSRLWFENQELKAETKDLLARTALMQMRLDRLSTVEQILQNIDPTEVSDLLSMIRTQQPAAVASLPSIPENIETPPPSPPATDAPQPADEAPLIDEGRVALENLLARPVQSDTRMELAYDLTNLDTSMRAEGRLRLSILTEDNEMLSLTLPSAASYFSMTTRKIVPRFTVALPDKNQSGAAKALVAEILLGDRLVLRHVYKLPAMPTTD